MKTYDDEAILLKLFSFVSVRWLQRGRQQAILSWKLKLSCKVAVLLLMLHQVMTQTGGHADGQDAHFTTCMALGTMAIVATPAVVMKTIIQTIAVAVQNLTGDGADGSLRK